MFLLISVWLVGALVMAVCLGLVLASANYREIASPCAIAIYLVWPFAVPSLILFTGLVMFRQATAPAVHRHSGLTG